MCVFVCVCVRTLRRMRQWHWMDGEAIDSMESFTYLGSDIHRDGLSSHDVQARIGKASKAFGSLKQAVFENRSLSLQCRRRVYVAVVLSTLLSGAETWTTKAPELRRLNLFHHQCVRSINGVSRRQQWETHATSSALAKTFGVPEDIGHIVRERRLRCLGHVARMEDHRLPKCVLFSEVPAPRMVHARGGGTSLWMTLRRLSHRYQHVDGTSQPRTVRNGVPLPVAHPRHPLLLTTVAPAAACSVEAAT